MSHNNILLIILCIIIDIIGLIHMILTVCHKKNPKIGDGLKGHYT